MAISVGFGQCCGTRSGVGQKMMYVLGERAKKEPQNDQLKKGMVK